MMETITRLVEKGLSNVAFLIEDLLSCNSAEVKSVECHLHALMCSVSVVTVVFIHTMEDDQRLNTLVHEGDTLHYSLQHCKKTVNHNFSVCF